MKIDWIALVLIAGALIAAQQDDLLACFMWVAGFGLGMFAIMRVDRRERS